MHIRHNELHEKMLFDSLFLHDIHEYNLRRGPDAVLPAPGVVTRRTR